MLVRVDSSNFHNAFESSCCFLIFRGQIFTVTAPRGEEFDNPDFITVLHPISEVAVCQL